MITTLDSWKTLEKMWPNSREEVSPNPKKAFFKLEQQYFHLDFLPEIPGLNKFRASFLNGIIQTIHNIEARYINYDDLILSKKALGRRKDIEDIDELRRRKDDQE